MLTKSYGEYFSSYQIELAERLKEEKIDESVIQRVLDSGFYIWQEGVQDGYYANRGAVGFEYFVKLLKGKANLFMHGKIPTYTINSFEEATKILDLPLYKRVINDICFRGQTAHVTSKRPFPHPLFTNDTGTETLLLPGYWRGFLDENKHISNKRPMGAAPSILEIFGDDLLYYGIDVPKLFKENNELYGPHFLSDIEDFPDKDSQEFSRRYNRKFTFAKSFEHSLIEQHYGLPTIGLDVSFDLKTALFFATNKFIRKKDGKASYIPINNGHEGVIYLLRFSSPKLIKTRDQVIGTSYFEHIPPVRPIKQSCALPFFHSTMVNEAAAHIVGIIRIGEQFDRSEVHNPADLFPSKEEDPFYNVLLEMKGKFPEELEDIVDYDFKS